MSMFGAPVTVVKGFIRKLRIDVPWNKLLSKPCEIYIEDVHVVIKPSAHFDEEFAKKLRWKIKKGQFDELLYQIRVSVSLLKTNDDIEIKSLKGTGTKECLLGGH